jgi:hypothetical protein
MRSRPLRAVCLLAIGTAALLPAPAGGAVGPAAEDHAFPAPPVDSTAIDAAFAPNGFAAVAWVEQIAASESVVEVALRPPGGDWSAPTRLSTRVNPGDPPSGRTLDDVHVAVNAGGAAAVAWHEHKTGEDVAAVSSRPADGDFTRPEAFSPGEVPRVGVSGAGLVTFFDSFDTAMTDRTLIRDTPAGGSVTGTFPVTLSSACGAFEADLAVAPSGEAIVGFACNGMSYSLRHNGVWGATSNPFVETFFNCPSQSTSTSFFNGHVAIDAGGNPVGVLQRNDTTVNCASPGNTSRSNQILLALPSAGVMAAVATPVAASGTGFNTSPIANDVVQPSVGIGGGSVVTEWSAGNAGGTASRPATRTYPGNGSGAPGAPEPIGDFVGAIDHSQVGVDAAGDALLAWTQLEGGETRAFEDFRPHGGTFSGAAVSDGRADATLTSSAVSDAGDGIIAFVEGPAAGPHVAHARGFDATPPQLTSVLNPATAQAGVPGAFLAQAFDVWGPVTVGWDFGDGTATGPTVAHAFAAPGPHTVTTTATDSVGTSVSTTGSVDVAAAPGGGGGPGGGAVAPGLTHISETNSKFRVGRNATPVSARRAPVGTTFRFSLDQPASVSIEIAQSQPGRRSGKRCVKPTRRNARKRRCTRFVKRGTLKRAGKAGANSVAFSGRIGRKPLKPGSYRATFTATAGGLSSKPATLKFRVVR